MKTLAWHSPTQLPAALLFLCIGACEIADSSHSPDDREGVPDAGPSEVCSWMAPAETGAVDEDAVFEHEKFLMSVIPVGEGFVAVGAQKAELNGFDTDILMRVSCDGENWEPTDAPAQPGRLDELAFGNQTLVAVGWNDAADSSAGSLLLVRRIGEPWQSITRANDERLHDLRFGNGMFVALDPRGVVCSADGLDWEHVAIDEPDLTGVRVFFDGSRFLTYSPKYIWSSLNGRDWVEEQLPRFFEGCNSFLSTRERFLGFCGDTYVEPGGDIQQTHVFALSNAPGEELGAVTLTAQPSLPYAPSAIANVGDSLVVLSGSQPYVTRLPLGSESWEMPDLSLELHARYDMASGPKRLVIVGYAIDTSPDGKTWVHHKLR
jgi:hypothetical protein